MIAPCAVGVDHHVLRPQVLVQHFQAMERGEAARELFDDATHGLDVRLRVVEHPLRQCPSLDVLGE